MIALDTNVLVRVLVTDNESQSRSARDLVEQCVARGEALYIGDLVLSELVWVLERAYKLRRSAISDALRTLRGLRHVVFASNARFDRAVERYAAGQGDLADHLLQGQAFDAGAEVVMTFDTTLHQFPEFRAP